MGITQTHIPEEVIITIFEHFKASKDNEFHEFHNLACTSKFFNKLIPEKLLKEKYDLYYPFLKLGLPTIEKIRDKEKYILYKIHIDNKYIGETFKCQSIEINTTSHVHFESILVTESLFNHRTFAKIKRLGVDIFNKILKGIYEEKANKRWKGKELIVCEIQVIKRQCFGWALVTEDINYPISIFVHELKFLHEFIRCFKEDILSRLEEHQVIYTN